jgi:hypothetical protein
MIPTYVVDELMLRLSSPRLRSSKLKAVCRLLEIDLHAALDPGPTTEEVVEQLSWRETPAFTGAVPFSFEVRCGDHVRQVQGRIVYASEGLNAIGEIQRTTSTCQALVWDPWEPAPEWQPMPENALPDELVQRLSGAVLDAVMEQQRTATSTQAETEA